MKKEFSMEDIQELLIKASMEYSHYTAFVQKFVISMEEYRKCNIAVDVKKEHICYSRKIHPQLERRTHGLKNIFLHVKLGQHAHFMVD